jgi:hypothetical protein
VGSRDDPPLCRSGWCASAFRRSRVSVARDTALHPGPGSTLHWMEVAELNFCTLSFKIRCAQIVTFHSDAACALRRRAPPIELHRMRDEHVFRSRCNKVTWPSTYPGFAHPVSVNIFSREANISSDDDWTILTTYGM